MSPVLSLRDCATVVRNIRDTKKNLATRWKEHNKVSEFAQETPPMNSSGKFCQLYLGITINMPSRKPAK